jgi:thioredoxin-dependent peroxiredoxin
MRPNSSSMLEVGAAAPPFRGRDQHDQEVVLEALLAKGPVVVYFYSRDFTPICTMEACAFRDAYEDMRDLGATVVGVSVDEQETHRRFAASHLIPFPLLPDVDRSIQQAFGAFRLFGLLNRRVTFVIGRDGIVHAAIAHFMSSRKHAEEVIDALRGLRRRTG